MTEKTNNIYQFKITLRETEPKIWRIIEVPENYSFWDLHVAIQDAMGWEDSHMHQFKIENPQTLEEEQIGIEEDEEDNFYGDVIIAGKTAKIAKYFLSSNSRAIYEYDFGDGWEHEITLEKILPAVPDTRYPQCIGGERACPPEDCGGTYGYEGILEVLKDPNHEEYQSIKKWIGGDFDPEKFDPEQVKFVDPKKRWKELFE